MDASRGIRLGGTRQRATLAILLLNANRVVSVDALADALYAGAPPVTALKQVQRQISELRKTIGSTAVIETRSPGYLIRLVPEQLDLHVFELLAADAAEAQARGQPRRAADLLKQALDLWRGAPLADLTYESFAQGPIERLEEIRLAAVEQLIDAELALGRHAELIPELEELSVEHPLRERLRAQLMLALYRSGRQADALAVFRQAREALLDGFGLEPSPALKELEHQILAQEPSLEFASDVSSGSSGAGERTVLAIPADDSSIARMAALAEPLARVPGRELIVARLVRDERELPAALESLGCMRMDGQPTIRIAAFTSSEPASDAVRFARAYDVELLLVDAPPETGAPRLPDELAALLEGSPADVGIVEGAPVDWTQGDGIYVPFGGAAHDWAALELGAWLASAAGVALRLVGARGDPARGRRDASRLLANASLAVQRLAGVSAEPLLVDTDAGALGDTVAAATLVVSGLSPRWATEGVGSIRGSFLRAGRPLVLVHGGPRPGALAPRDARTRFSWSLAT